MSRPQTERVAYALKLVDQGKVTRYKAADLAGASRSAVYRAYEKRRQELLKAAAEKETR